MAPPSAVHGSRIASLGDAAGDAQRKVAVVDSFLVLERFAGDVTERTARKPS
jgi:hypothetical protein